MDRCGGCRCTDAGEQGHCFLGNLGFRGFTLAGDQCHLEKEDPFTVPKTGSGMDPTMLYDLELIYSFGFNIQFVPFFLFYIFLYFLNLLHKIN